MRIDLHHPDVKQYNIHVFVDGVEQPLCIEADDEAGWAKVYVTDTHGFLVIDDDHTFKTTIVRGRVQLQHVKRRGAEDAEWIGQNHRR